MAVGGVYVVVTAAGSGTRLGADGPKALVPLRGRSLLWHCLESLSSFPPITGVCVTAPSTHLDAFRQVADEVLPDTPHAIVAGGKDRQTSVFAGLQGLLTLPTAGPSPDNEDAIVLVHDAARPLTPKAVFERVCTAVHGGCPAVVPALPLVDTIRQVAGPARSVDNVSVTPAGSTPDRSSFRAVQTPQGFRGDVVFAAHRAASSDDGDGALDDAMLAARLGYRQYFVDGSDRALKITYPADLTAAGALLDVN